MHSCKADYQKNGGTARKKAVVTSATCTTRWPVARQRSRRDMARHLTKHQFPCGTLVEYIPITAKEKSRVHQFGKKALKGLFLGCVLHAEGGWSEALMTADNEDLQESEASEIHVRRFRSKEVLIT